MPKAPMTIHKVPEQLDRVKVIIHIDVNGIKVLTTMIYRTECHITINKSIHSYLYNMNVWYFLLPITFYLNHVLYFVSSNHVLKISIWIIMYKIITFNKCPFGRGFSNLLFLDRSFLSLSILSCGNPIISLHKLIHNDITYILSSLLSYIIF